MGLFSPLRFSGINLMQELWELNIAWDEPIPQNKAEQLNKIENMLHEILNFKFPRFIGPVRPEDTKYSLMCFCDASKKAYATTVYMHISSTTECKSELIFAKTRPTPKSMKKKQCEATIPRLELMAILIGAKALRWLKAKLKEIIQIEFQHIHLWSDSTAALNWIASTKKLPVFIENRVREIQTCPNIQFHHVTTDENPADLATRSFESTLNDFMNNNLWWHGPSWLQQPQDNWPKDIISSVPIEEISLLADREHPKEEQRDFLMKIENYSTLTRLLRVTA